MKSLLRSSPGARFVLVGIVATAIDFGLLFLAQAVFDWPVLLSNIFATSVAFMFSFSANRSYTFQSSNKNVLREMVLFTIVTLFGLWVLQSIVITLALPLLSSLSNELALLIAKLLATLVSMTWNYLLYSRLVFTERKP